MNTTAYKSTGFATAAKLTAGTVIRDHFAQGNQPHMIVESVEKSALKNRRGRYTFNITTTEGRFNWDHDKVVSVYTTKRGR